ncbi:MAG: hypothetical protein ACXVGG_13660, partial [Mycobacteriaceae bacterium]
IPYSTWHRHCVELTALGLVKQVVRGNSILNLAAEYQLLFVAPLTDGLPTTTQGEGDYITTKSKSNPQGGAPAREKAPWPELTPYELAAWEDFTARLRPRLDSSDLAMLNEQIHGFDQVIPLQRTVVRLVQHGHGPSLLNALAERGNPDLPVYGGARNLPATLFKRLQRFADQHQVRVWDRSAVVAEEASPYKQAWDALGLRVGGADSPPQEQRHP